ncbi:FmdB family transcriptional regulator [Citricoccus sp. SGAir0253]|uniref:FmdB family zinc ribbon protein n=1 Tax=Citricoccus sp. SGAir0253 TaxID=2567881 RepID=UPI0010CCB2E8|nr:FmdB family zinc ribbon protein [Citricoccus sp. SGAir0253]QCU77611.1 FmdB family transcriptional regulator [Citricoccus sp. SGAir0253]
MPTYAYACKDCGHAFDIVQSFSDDSLTVCPQCEGTLRKKFNSVGVVFKGSGFYRNDSRSDRSGSTAGSSTAAASASGDSAASAGSSSTSGSSSSSSDASAGSSAPAPAKTPAAASA